MRENPTRTRNSLAERISAGKNIDRVLTHKPESAGHSGSKNQPPVRTVFSKLAEGLLKIMFRCSAA